MTLNFQKAHLNGKQYYVVPEDVFPLLKLSATEQKGLLKMEFGQSFYLVPTGDPVDNYSTNEIETFMENLLKCKTEDTYDDLGSCGSHNSGLDVHGCGYSEDPCGHHLSSSSSGCGYSEDPCGHTYYRSSGC